jgi:hypothetical protein
MILHEHYSSSNINIVIICIPDLKIYIFINHNCLYITEKEGCLQSIRCSPNVLPMFISGSIHLISDLAEMKHMRLYSFLIFTCIWAETTWDGSIIVLSVLHFP